MRSPEIREKFLKFFENQGHRRIKSSPLIPAADPTLLFTNSGMVQFKDCFLGAHDPGYRRATTAQKCVRAGGKHNDLENVGFTPRHHTFFEMLGNFSFGDYFKKDAIAFAWELVTRHYAIPKDRLRITVFKDDDEAFELWKAQGVLPDRIERLGEKDNFWAMGDTGPCGPCSEIYFDWGMEHASRGDDGTPGTDASRFVEIWNLVFMQFNRDASGKLAPLPKPSVDTGAGLERVASVLQGRYSNYDTDIFQGIIEAISRRVGKAYGSDEKDSTSIRVIADHLRSGTFLMADGVFPSNEGRGYVLRRILRRAIRHGKRLGQEQAFLHELVSSVVGSLGDIYPEIRQGQHLIETQMREEEVRFHETLHRGMGLLEETMRAVLGRKGIELPGDVVFKLYDTFGFPLDLIEVVCRENGLDVDQKGFDALMAGQRAQSTFAGAKKGPEMERIEKVVVEKKLETRFQGYDGTVAKGCSPVALFTPAGEATRDLSSGEKGWVIFDRSPFYAESGGQVGDRGWLRGPDGEAEVLGTFKIQKAFVHSLRVTRGRIGEGRTAELEVDAVLRKRTATNHTATHLLHAALRNRLGDRVKQAGSLVDPARLRFDFTFPRGLTPEERGEIEAEINDQVRRSSQVTIEEMPYDAAIKSGAIAFFDEKYGDRVRVVKVAGGEKPYSVELCGGTHLSNIADIVFFKLLSESSVASGVRRIEAVTADTAISLLLDRDASLRQVERTLNVDPGSVAAKAESLVRENAQLRAEVEGLKIKLAAGSVGGKGEGAALHERARDVSGLRVVTEIVPAASPKILRTLVDQIRDRLKDKTVVALACEEAGKAAICVGVTRDLTEKFDASRLIQPMAKEVGGTGGGRADFAQAGGTAPAGISRAFELLVAAVREGAGR